MNSIEFDKVLENRIRKIREVLQTKGKEYALADKLSNFKRAADLEGVTSIQALLGFVAKHIIALYDFAKRDDISYGQWEEKLGDTINYMILLDGILIEEINNDLKVKGILQ